MFNHEQMGMLTNTELEPTCDCWVMMLFNGHCSHVQNGEATPWEQRNGSKDWPKISINQRGGAAGPLLQVYWLNFNLQDTFRFFPWFLQWNMGWSATYFGIGRKIRDETFLAWEEASARVGGSDFFLGKTRKSTCWSSFAFVLPIEMAICGG